MHTQQLSSANIQAQPSISFIITLFDFPYNHVNQCIISLNMEAMLSRTRGLQVST